MNTDTLSGKLDQAVGKAKQGVGETVGDQELANSGAADQVKGNAKEAWGNVKDTASATAGTAHAEANAASEQAGSNDADTLRDKVVRGATNAKNSVDEKVNEFRANHTS